MRLLVQIVASAVLMAAASAAHAYDFVVINSSSSSITRVLVSEDGKNWGQFRLSGPIAPGKRMTLVWSPETDDSGCEWLVVAHYADGSESGAASFDFCEDNLELEFED